MTAVRPARDRVGNRDQAGLRGPTTRRRRLEPPGDAAVHARALPGHVPRPAVDDPPVRGLRLGRGDERALPLPARARADGPLDRLRPADAARLRLRRPARRSARWGAPASRSTRSPTWSSCSTAIPLGEVSTSMTINAPAALLLLLYELVAEEQGVAPRGAARHRPERHPQGVHRARELHLPAAAVDAADDRPLRVLRRAHPALEHDLDLRLPHPRGRLDRGAGARVHARERDRLRARRPSRRASRRTSSARGSRSSSTRTTTSSRRWRSSARRGGCGRG